MSKQKSSRIWLWMNMPIWPVQQRTGQMKLRVGLISLSCRVALPVWVLCVVAGKEAWKKFSWTQGSINWKAYSTEVLPMDKFFILAITASAESSDAIFSNAQRCVVLWSTKEECRSAQPTPFPSSFNSHYWVRYNPLLPKCTHIPCFLIRLCSLELTLSHTAAEYSLQIE